jgi:hypothetical protein
MVRSKAAEVPGYSALWLSAHFCQSVATAPLQKLILGQAGMVSFASDESKQSCRCTLKSSNRKWSNIAPTVRLKQYAIELTSVPNIFLKILKLLSSSQKWKLNQITQVHTSVKRIKMYHQFCEVGNHHITLTKVKISADLKQDWQ